MILDSGMITVFSVSSTEGKEPPPIRHTLSPKLTCQYGERVVGATRYYAAAKVGQQIDRTVRIWRSEGITIRDVCLVGGRYYRIRKVTLTVDEDGLFVTDLDLEDDDNILRGLCNENRY
ncbi:MAG: hypothetical protein KHW69_06885 [Clostridium sp.]|jgi:hypothetical protein|nr:hypothetical protein [Clostridium sp.]DAF21418.1 MAG TPA: PORTAL PROTEIN, 15 PROTEIN, HEAD PROTEIN, TAILED BACTERIOPHAGE, SIPHOVIRIDAE.6A [Caudoviricetes sp.]